MIPALQSSYPTQPTITYRRELGRNSPEHRFRRNFHKGKATLRKGEEEFVRLFAVVILRGTMLSCTMCECECEWVQAFELHCLCYCSRGDRGGSWEVQVQQKEILSVAFFFSLAY